MAKKMTLEMLAAQLSKMDARIERGFGAVAEDISKLATKDQIIALHTPKALDALIEKRIAYLSDYQNEAYAKPCNCR